jgi:hypothetical protein
VDSDAARELARRIVATAAPDEVPYFDVLARGGPARGSAPERRRDRPGEAGFPDLVATLTPIAMYVATMIVNRLTDDIVGKARDRLVGRVRRWWRQRRTPSGSSGPSGKDGSAALEKLVVGLGPQELAELERFVATLYARRGMTQDEAEQLATDTIAALLT